MRPLRMASNNEIDVWWNIPEMEEKTRESLLEMINVEQKLIYVSNITANNR